MNVSKEISWIIKGWFFRKEAFEAAKKRYPSVVLSVRATNPAIRLYEKMGFVIVGKTVNRVGTESLNMLIHLS